VTKPKQVRDKFSAARLLRNRDVNGDVQPEGDGPSPGPVVIQRRAQAARYARASADAIRVGVLMIADSFVLSVVYSVADYLRSPSAPWKAFAGLLIGLVPRGTLPRVEVLFGVLLGLALLGNYGAGPFRRNVGRLYAGSRPWHFAGGWPGRSRVLRPDCAAGSQSDVARGCDYVAGIMGGDDARERSKP
jgi:hypothetical protein